MSNRWFSETMHMVSIYSISKAVAAELRNKDAGKEWRAMGTPKSDSADKPWLME